MFTAYATVVPNAATNFIVIVEIDTFCFYVIVNAIKIGRNISNCN